jgi:hypothetical protein
VIVDKVVCGFEGRRGLMEGELWGTKVDTESEEAEGQTEDVDDNIAKRVCCKKVKQRIECLSF